jgi:hypothetical protein
MRRHLIFFFFLIQKNLLYKRKYIETPGTPELPRDCRESVTQFTGENKNYKKKKKNLWSGRDSNPGSQRRSIFPLRHSETVIKLSFT